MRRCIKYFIMHVLAVGLLLTAITGAATAYVNDVVESSFTSWPSTIYYLAHLSGPAGDYGNVTVYITAVDEYTLYINGTEVGSGVHINPDTGAVQIDSLDVNIPSDDNIIIGVKVKNNGVGNGNGLMVDIKDANSDWLGTTTMSRRTHIVGGTRVPFGVAWYYYAGDVIAALGDDWYDQDTGFFEDGKITQEGFKQVILGQMIDDEGKPRDIGYQPDNHLDIVTGYPGDIDIGSSEGGGIRLRRVDGENLALKKPTQEEKLTDGDLTNGYAFNQDPVGIKKYIDLEEIRRVNKMILFTGGSNPDNWSKVSVRGYSVWISQDQFRYEEVGVLHEIGISNADEGDYDWYAISFPDEWARYLQFEITEPRISYPNIGEVMIYGVGHVYDGDYISDWYDFGAPDIIKNFKEVSWSGNLDPGTRITVATQTKLGNGDPSGWSIEHSDTTFAFDSPEPATAFRYRVKLFTQDIDFSPEFQKLSVTYSVTDQPVSSAEGYVLVLDTPVNKVPMGETKEFEYIVEYTLNAGQNIKRIEINVPGEADVDSVRTVDGLFKDNIVYDSTTEIGTLKVTFPELVTGGNKLSVYFKSKLLTNLHDFQAYLYNDTENDEAGGVKIWEKSDKSWTVTTSTILESILSNVAAVPKVFTPNNDDKNEFTVIEFTLAKVETDVIIKFYNTKGRLITLREFKGDDKLLAKDHFFVNKAGKAADAVNLPGYWDGTDDNGDLVPPGVYIYQVVADTDSGDKIEGGTVIVAY